MKIKQKKREKKKKVKKEKYEEIGQRGGASLWRVHYQRGLPRLVNQLMVSKNIFAAPPRPNG